MQGRQNVLPPSCTVGVMCALALAPAEGTLLPADSRVAVAAGACLPAGEVSPRLFFGF